MPHQRFTAIAGVATVVGVTKREGLMFEDAKAVLAEMITGLLWPINAPLEWCVEHWKVTDWIKALEVIGVFTAIVVVIWEFRVEKPVDRAVRISTMFAQIAQVHALPNGSGSAALKPTLQILANENVSMIDIDLSAANLTKVNLTGALMNGAKLNQAKMTGSVLNEATLSGAHMREVNLRRAEMIKTNLVKADLSMANLQRATLTSAYLGWANLSFSDLTAADLTEADLTGADLRGADMSWATLTEVDLTRADLTTVMGYKPEQFSAACQKENHKPPKLPEGIEWHGRVCERYKQ